eukprot:jgi/Tetstr1/448025/TSEL_035326.t1
MKLARHRPAGDLMSETSRPGRVSTRKKRPPSHLRTPSPEAIPLSRQTKRQRPEASSEVLPAKRPCLPAANADVSGISSGGKGSAAPKKRAKKGSTPGVLKGATPRAALLRFCAGTSTVRGKTVSLMKVEPCWAQCVAMMPPDEEPPPVYSFAPKDDAAQLLTDYITRYTSCSDIVTQDVCSSKSTDDGDRALFFLPKGNHHSGGYEITDRFRKILAGKPWPPVPPVTVKDADGNDVLKLPDRRREGYDYSRPKNWKELQAADRKIGSAAPPAPPERAYEEPAAATEAPQPPVIPPKKRPLRELPAPNTPPTGIMQSGAQKLAPARKASLPHKPPPGLLYRPGMYHRVDALVEAARIAAQAPDCQADSAKEHPREGGRLPIPVHLAKELFPSAGHQRLLQALCHC